MEKENFLVDLMLSYMDKNHQTILNNEREILEGNLRLYIRNEITYKECSKKFVATFGSAEPLEFIHKIIKMPNDPIKQKSIHKKMFVLQSVMRKKPQPWSKLEDMRLLSGVYRFGTHSWSKVAEFIGNGRTRNQCAQRFYRCLDPKISKQKWTKEEEMKLLSLVKKHGTCSWMKISCEMGNRTDVQCRYHFQHSMKGIDFVSVDEKSDDKSDSLEENNVQPIQQTSFNQFNANNSSLATNCNASNFYPDFGRFSSFDNIQSALNTYDTLNTLNKMAQKCEIPVAPLVNHNLDQFLAFFQK
ncbi:Myb-like DNA-binding domain containing protein [Tritrichomonas foetus]|uniref:Myb-like DNA-binding domain containing protein n=1 Tax=Tritrichomonas foetus TaxID=1144522 RepID=A0A1J4JM67_9EUKA|nr:Myb-like DNA-binding domain containing protein [Tritrichomonas foetus]|eukprot:OHS99519.1 Myb-like DNA-binding domain containing protein [Tritrichomonas foetus]